MDASTRRLVRERAGDHCEYCGLPQRHSPLASLQIEHILPKKHGGADDDSNLALACIDCNLAKGSHVAGYDPETGVLTPLFDPRRQRWADHFSRQRLLIIGISPIGRTTVVVLRLNSHERLELRSVSGE